MAIDPLAVWKTTLEDLKPSGNVSWALNFASWIDKRVTGKLVVGAQVSQSKFTFSKSVFAAALQALAPTDDPVAGLKKFADAWEKAILSSTMVVPPGAYFQSASSATKWSTVTASVIDPASIALGRAVILTLAAAPVAATASSSIFPEKFRKAFLLLTVTITGVDSQVPPTGPLPLTLPNAPVK